MLHIFNINDINFNPAYLSQNYIKDRIDCYWYGGLTRNLSLSKSPNVLDMQKVLNLDFTGKLAGGKRDNSKGKAIHLTFSPPKSFSVAALVFNDEFLINVHENAVINTIDYISKYLTCRTTEKGVQKYNPINNLLMAVFHRALSREGDPHLQSHVIIFNKCDILGDDTLRAIDFSILYHAKIMFGVYYRAELIKLLNSVIPLLIKDDCLFELNTIPPNLSNSFSKRSEQVATKLNQEGINFQDSSIKKKALATRFSARKLNLSSSIDDFRYLWLKIVPSDFQYKQSINQHADGNLIHLSDDLLINAFDELVRLTLFKEGVPHYQLIRHLLSLYDGNIDIEQIDRCLSDLVVNGMLYSDGYPRTLFNPSGYKNYLSRKIKPIKIKPLPIKVKEAKLKKDASMAINLTVNEYKLIEPFIKKTKKSLSDLVIDLLPIISSLNKVNLIDVGKKYYQLKFRINSAHKVLIAQNAAKLNCSSSDIVISAFINKISNS